jgi:mannose-6-phosphate isomerase-like protein (cupin superfamily)
MTTAKPDALPAGAIVLPPDGGRAYAMKTMRAVFKADGAETGNRYSISEWWLDPRKPGPGAHKHDANDEIFYVIAGTPSILLGERWIDAPRGAFIRIPAGLMHDFENRTDERIGLLNFFIPGGFEPMMPMIVQWFDENR